MLNEFKHDLQYLKTNFWPLLRKGLLFVGVILGIVLVWNLVGNIFFYLGMNAFEAYLVKWAGILLSFGYLAILKLKAEGRELEQKLKNRK